MRPPDRFRLRWAVTIGLLVALFSPVVGGSDGLPLSTYPMYAHTRDADVQLIRVVGLDSNGEEVALSIRTIADTRDPLVAQSYLDDMVAAGMTAALCEDVSDRVSDQIAEVRVLRETHDVVARATGESSLRSDAELLAGCETP